MFKIKQQQIILNMFNSIRSKNPKINRSWCMSEMARIRELYFCIKEIICPQKSCRPHITNVPWVDMIREACFKHAYILAVF
jgi:hypothetical protein